MNSKLAVLMMAVVACMMSACSLAPLAMQKAGIGVTGDDKLPQLTSTVFNTSESNVVVSNIRRENTLNGTFIYYTARVNKKDYSCGLVSSFANNAMPKCVDAGKPLDLSVASH